MVNVLCSECSKQFQTTERRISQGRGKFCSSACFRLSTRMTDEKFKQKINKNGPQHSALRSRCWVWTGYVASDGYGVARYMRVGVQAHRKSWELFKGTVPEGMWVLHKCDNRRCVRPSHLFLGTCSDNIKDRDGKGRQSKGDNHHLSKLKSYQVVEIRTLYDAALKNGKRVSFKSLSTRFGVSPSQIRHIGKRWCWKHIPEG